MASMGPQFNPCGRFGHPFSSRTIAEASMGPQFNPCGRRDAAYLLQPPRMLQWGRSLIPAEGSLAFWAPVFFPELQWGRSLIPAEGRCWRPGMGAPRRFNGAAV